MMRSSRENMETNLSASHVHSHSHAPKTGQQENGDGDENLTELVAPAPVRVGVHTDDNGDEEDTYEKRQVSSADGETTRDVDGHDSDGVDRERTTRKDGERTTTDQREERRQKLWREVASLSWIIFFSIMGTLARLGVEAIATYPYAPVTSSVLWANLGGSLFMGFLIEDRRLFYFATDAHLLKTDNERNIHSHVGKRKKVLPLYIGLATGFCGSFTSFSTFITDAFLALSNSLPGPSSTSPYHTVTGTLTSRNAGYSFMAVLGIVILQTAVSLGALKTGAHLAVGADGYMPSLSARLVHKVLDPVAVVIGFGSWIGAIMLAIWPPEQYWRRNVALALVFAPPGAVLRFYLSKMFNARIPSFPLGTFIVNIFGTIVAGVCYDLQHARATVGSADAMSLSLANMCGVLDGIEQGFCGCATTVSTWVAELNSLRRRHAWIYGVASVVIAVAFQVIIMGSLAWTQGFDPSCSTRI